MGKEDKDEEKPSDPRVAATGAISGATIGALAVCIPIVAITRSPMIAMLVVGGAAVAIAGIWISGRSKEVAAKSEQIENLESTIKDLQERLENVEVINRYETTLAERALEEEESSKPRSMGPKEVSNGQAD